MIRYLLIIFMTICLMNRQTWLIGIILFTLIINLYGHDESQKDNK